MTEFDEAVALTAAGDGYAARLTDGWAVGHAVNGGILVAVAVEAVRRAVEAAGGHGDPLVFSSHFLSAARPGPAMVRTEVLRTGRSLSTGQASMTQLGEEDEDPGRPVERLRVIATLGDLDGRSAPVWRSAVPPQLPPPERCVTARRTDGEFARHIRMLDRLDLRLDPETAGWAVGRPSRRGEIRGWVRFADGRAPDVAALPFFLDALMPVAFDLGALGWAPTIELTGHVRGRPAPGWLQVSLETHNVIGGLLEEDATLWDGSGRVVAQSRQLAGVRMPAAPEDGPAPTTETAGA